MIVFSKERRLIMAYNELERFQQGGIVVCRREPFLAPEWVEKGGEYLVLTVTQNQYADCTCGGAGDQHDSRCSLVAQLHPDDITIKGPNGQVKTLNASGFKKKT
jgi:hypothetical protein